MDGTTRMMPLVFDYLDLSSYLQDYYEFRKQTSKDFSYDSWCSELEFNKNRSFLRLIALGKKKASPLFISAFCKKAFSSPQEEEYFRCLVNYSQAPNQRDRQAFGLRLTQILRVQMKSQVIENYENFVSSPFLPRLFTLLTFQDLHPVSKTFAKLLNCSDQQAREGLIILRDLGLAKEDAKTGLWKSTCERFKVSDQQGSQQLMSFHEQSMQDAVKAFHLPKQLRKYKALLLALSDSELDEFYEALDTFATSQVSRFTPSAYEGRRVFQINMNIHSVSELS